jgi:SAM-dependent methyltransferase
VTLNVEEFTAQYGDELEEIQIQHFFRELVPVYFTNYVIPEIPKDGKVLDIGCGFGTLIQILKERGTHSELIGIDIKSSPDWDTLSKSNVRLQIVSEDSFLSFINTEAPDSVVMTWTLHHMKYDEQKRYLKALSNTLKEGAKVIILEDSYATTLKPETGEETSRAFMELRADDKQKVMGALDWIANCILSKRTTMPVPFSYRTLEDWSNLLEGVGFTVQKMRFLGFPENRDVDNPQSVIVARKQSPLYTPSRPTVH